MISREQNEVSKAIVKVDVYLKQKEISKAVIKVKRREQNEVSKAVTKNDNQRTKGAL